MLVTGIGRKTDDGKRWTLLAMRLLVLFAASFSMAWAVPAEAKRVALIIANSAYHRGSGKSLFNVGVDGPKVEAALKAADFDVVKLAPNLGLTDFGNALAAFQQEAMGADVALIYYAGHGIQTPAGKFAIPVDADIPSELLLNQRAINVDIMIGALSGARASILVLDACRTNGFADTWGTATRSAQFSFSTDIESTQRNLLALYSAMPGQEARDGNRGEGSPFANAFVRYIQEPGLELTQLAPRIAQTVEKDTGNLQTPTSSGSMAQVIVLKPLAIPDDPFAERMDWSAAVRTGTIESYQAFVDKWPNSGNNTIAYGEIFKLGGIPRRPVAVSAETAAPAMGTPTVGASSPSPTTVSDPAPQPFGITTSTSTDGRDGIASGPSSNDFPDRTVAPAQPSGGGQLAPERIREQPGAATQISFPPPTTAPGGGAQPGAATNTSTGSLSNSGGSSHSGGNSPVSAGVGNRTNVTTTGQSQGLSNGSGRLTSDNPGTGPAAGSGTGGLANPPFNPAPQSTPTQPLAAPPVRVEPTTGMTSTENGTLDATELQRRVNAGAFSGPGDPFRPSAAKDLLPLPPIPGPPRFSDAGYPACRDDFQPLPTNRAKIAKIDECLNRLLTYTKTTLLGFVDQINAHQEGLDKLFRATMPGVEAKYTFTSDTQKKFHDDIMREFNASGEGAPYRAEYEATNRRMETDRAYLGEQRAIFVKRAETAD